MITQIRMAMVQLRYHTVRISLHTVIAFALLTARYDCADSFVLHNPAIVLRHVQCIHGGRKLWASSCRGLYRDKLSIMFSSSNDNAGDEIVDPTEIDIEDFETVEVSDEMWAELEDSAPPFAVILSKLLGINIFTYILASLIVIFMSLNYALGPGWLGQKIGIPGTGTFTEYSQSVPGPMDLNNADNLL